MKEPKQTGSTTVTIDGKAYTVRVFGETPEDIAKSKKREKDKRNKVGRSFSGYKTA
jgi:capsid protein